MKDQRHSVWITLDERLFSKRYGFGESSEFGAFIHKFLIGILEATKSSDDEPEDVYSVQIGVYRKSPKEKTKIYHVPEGIAKCFYALNLKLRDKTIAFCNEYEDTGKNLLLQMLKSDVIGESLQNK